MRIVFYINDDNAVVKVDNKFVLIEGLLYFMNTINPSNNINNIDNALAVIKKSNYNFDIWEEGYEVCYLSIRKDSVRVVGILDRDNMDKYLEEDSDKEIKQKKISGNYKDYIDIEINLFKKILLEWKKFVEKTDTMAYPKKKNYREVLEIVLPK